MPNLVHTERVREWGARGASEKSAWVYNPHLYMQQTMWVQYSSFCERMPQAGQAIVKPRANTSFMRNSNAHDIKWVCIMSSFDSLKALACSSDIRRGGPIEYKPIN